MSTVDKIDQTYAEREVSTVCMHLTPGSQTGFIVGVLDEAQRERDVIVLDITIGPEGPMVMVMAFGVDGQARELGRVETGQLGQMLLHVVTR